MIQNSRAERASFYSPFSFIRGACRLGETWLDGLGADQAAGEIIRLDGATGSAVYYRQLAWDTGFFGVPTMRVEFTDHTTDTPVEALRQNFNDLFQALSATHPRYYLFAEVPCEDTQTILAMTQAGMRLIETRVTYFRDDIQRFELERRDAVRRAIEADIPALRQCAIDSVNHFDRFHADDFFTPQQSDDFMGVFVENSVKGFADEVLVPESGPADAFLTANYVKTPSELQHRRFGKMVLSAVAPARRGWYVKLIGAMSAQFRAAGVDTAFMTTQATNRAVLKVWHHHGYQYGRCTHIFSTYPRP